MRDLLDRLIAGIPPGAEPLTHVEQLPDRVGRAADWPAWVPAQLRDRLAGCGIAAP
jgi:DEAD/DEAH box helicase domain-containing protein